VSSILGIAASGLNDSTLRLANAASNIANVSSTSKLPAAGGTYTGFQPQDVVTLSAGGGGTGSGVTPSGVTSSLRPRSPAYSATAAPGSSDADANSLVATPNVDLATELIASKQAVRSYQAGAAIIRTADEMQKSLLNAVT
jgi:flagellar basal-body rod protein FlgC